MKIHRNPKYLGAGFETLNLNVLGLNLRDVIQNHEGDSDNCNSISVTNNQDNNDNDKDCVNTYIKLCIYTYILKTNK